MLERAAEAAKLESINFCPDVASARIPRTVSQAMPATLGRDRVSVGAPTASFGSALRATAHRKSGRIKLTQRGGTGGWQGSVSHHAALSPLRS